MINWAYIAGVFDGEGSCGLWKNGKRTYSAMVAAIPQSSVNNGEEFLLRIKEFLELQGIPATVSHGHGASRKNAMFQLKITNLVGLRKFFEGILPFVIVKKLSVQDHLRYLKLFPPLSDFRFLCSERVPKLDRNAIVRIRSLCTTNRHGLKAQLAREYGVTHSTIRAVVNNKMGKYASL